MLISQTCMKSELCPMRDNKKLCHWLPENAIYLRFYCKNGSILNRRIAQCNGILDCAEGEDEWFCDLNFPWSGISLEENSLSSLYPLILRNFSIPRTRLINNIQNYAVDPLSVKSSWFCNRGMPIMDNQSSRCLCSPSYSGYSCENQRERVLVILKIISSPMRQQDFAIKFIMHLIDIITLDILVEEETVHLPYIHLSHKHLTLLSSPRANNSFVRIDAYDVSVDQILAYRTSWKFDLPFSFLPVRRLAISIDWKNEDDDDDAQLASRRRFTCPKCVRGQCLKYENSEGVFCHCFNGWTGSDCNEPLVCARGSTSLSSHRCLCPMNRHGTRCFASYIPTCQCQNAGTCIPLDARSGQSACLCTSNYFGRYCELQHAKIAVAILSKSQPQVLPIVVFQFLLVTGIGNIFFETTSMLESVLSGLVYNVHHLNYEYLPRMVLAKVFYSSSANDYNYYIILSIHDLLYAQGIRPQFIETQLDPTQKCPHVRDVEALKTPINILAYPHVKRSKFYLRACDENIMRCFHDEVYICFCPTQVNRTVYCLNHDHQREQCRKPSYCLNGGLCIENRQKGTVTFACLCKSCQYSGKLCQFYTGQQGLSLDALLGSEIRTGKALREQSTLIKVIIALLVSMITLGLIGNILCIIIFAQKASRKAGCGYYLLAVSVSNQVTLLILGARFAYVLLTQMVVWKNRGQSLILCKCLEFGLTLLPNLSQWLSACVSVERTIAVARGALFDRRASIRTSKQLCLALLVVLTALGVHVPINCQLIEDPRLGRYTWCVSKLGSVELQRFTSIVAIVQLLGPFILIFLSTGTLIVIITRQKLNVRQNGHRQSFLAALREQVDRYKHLIISSVCLLILTLPRLFVSFGSLCIDGSWQNYVFLAGYLISFVPFVATLAIFVVPSPVYQNELQLISIRFCRALHVH